MATTKGNMNSNLAHAFDIMSTVTDQQVAANSDHGHEYHARHWDLVPERGLRIALRVQYIVHALAAIKAATCVGCALTRPRIADQQARLLQSGRADIKYVSALRRWRLDRTRSARRCISAATFAPFPPRPRGEGRP